MYPIFTSYRNFSINTYKHFVPSEATVRDWNAARTRCNTMCNKIAVCVFETSLTSPFFFTNVVCNFASNNFRGGPNAI